MKLSKIFLSTILLASFTGCWKKSSKSDSTSSNLTVSSSKENSTSSNAVDSDSTSTSSSSSSPITSSQSNENSSTNTSSNTPNSSSSYSSPSSSSSSSSVPDDIKLATGSTLLFDFEDNNTSKNTNNYSNGIITSKGYDFSVISCMYDTRWPMENGDSHFGNWALRFSNKDFTGEIESLNRYNIAKLEIYAAKFNHSKEANSMLYLQTSSDKKTWKDLGPNVDIDHTELWNYWWNINDLVYFRINFIGYPGTNARVNMDNLSITFR